MDMFDEEALRSVLEMGREAHKRALSGNAAGAAEILAEQRALLAFILDENDDAELGIDLMPSGDPD